MGKVVKKKKTKSRSRVQLKKKPKVKSRVRSSKANVKSRTKAKVRKATSSVKSKKRVVLKKKENVLAWKQPLSTRQINNWSSSPAYAREETRHFPIRPYINGKTSTYSNRRQMYQELLDLEHKIRADFGTFLVLKEEGNHMQIERAKQKARTDLLKYGPDMSRIAQKLGGSLPRAVHNFLQSIDAVIHSATGWIDDDKIIHCYNSTEALEHELKRSA